MSYLPPRRRRWWLTVAAVTVASVVVGLVAAIPIAALVMLLFGAAHAEDPRIPALGIRACYPLVVAAWVLARGVEVKFEVDR